MLRRLDNVPRLVTLLFSTLMAILILIPVRVLLAAAQAPGHTKTLQVIGLIIIAVSAYFLWLFQNWINGLAGFPSKLTLQQSGRQLGGWMTVLLVVGVLGVLTGTLNLFLPQPSGAPAPGWTLAYFLFAAIGAVAARTWFTDRLSVKAAKQRPVLIVMLWLHAALNTVQIILTAVSPTQALARTTALGWAGLILNVVIGLLTLLAYFFTTQLVQRTMGPERHSSPQQAN